MPCHCPSYYVILATKTRTKRLLEECGAGCRVRRPGAGRMQFPGTMVYAATAAEVEAVAQRVLGALPRPAPTIGIDFEWWFQGNRHGPIATIQMCWEEGSGQLHAAVLHVARLAPQAAAARRMTPSLRALLQDGSVRKVTFGNYDQKRFFQSYGWRVASMVDLQPCLGTTFGGLLPDIRRFPRLAECAAWVLGHDVDKGLQTSNGWEENRRLSGEEIAYAATDAYAHLMLWRAALTYEGMLRPLTAAADTAADADARAADAAQPATAAAEEPAAGAAAAGVEPAMAEPQPEAAAQLVRSGKRTHCEDGNSAAEQRCTKRLAPDTEEQEDEPLLVPASQPDGQEQQSGYEAAGSDASQGSGEETGEEVAALWGRIIQTRFRICGSWHKLQPWAEVEAARQAARQRLVAALEAGLEEDGEVAAQMEHMQSPMALPLVEPPGAEQLARRLVWATPSAPQ